MPPEALQELRGMPDEVVNNNIGLNQVCGCDFLDRE